MDLYQMGLGKRQSRIRKGIMGMLAELLASDGLDSVVCQTVSLPDSSELFQTNSPIVGSK